MSAMALGLSHSLSRYKLKFSPDKVDTMIVQAIGMFDFSPSFFFRFLAWGVSVPFFSCTAALLDDLDKELNTYAMRVREWYGWHFPELS